jgi:hypothetical protein
MLRTIGAVIAGYVTMAVAIFATFTVAYLMLGQDGRDPRQRGSDGPAGGSPTRALLP